MMARSGTFWMRLWGSISAPIVTKKSATKTSRSGRSRASVSCAYSDPLMMSPARKAPSASESPAAWLRAAVPSPTARATSRNISSLCSRATRVIRGGTTLAAT